MTISSFFRFRLKQWCPDRPRWNIDGPPGISKTFTDQYAN